ncbi:MULTISPECIES: hypothetical protein [unclassified Microcoleus]|uniref:hypothetical protein n=1 Tax=unclassified Microcoleus TaxID=2642155 RepID=UPI002FD54821
MGCNEVFRKKPGFWSPAIDFFWLMCDRAMAYAPLRYDSSTCGGRFCLCRRGFNRRVFAQIYGFFWLMCDREMGDRAIGLRKAPGG